MKMLSKFSCVKDTINNTIQNISIILIYSVFKALKRNYMLNLTTSNKILETLFCQ